MAMIKMTRTASHVPARPMAQQPMTPTKRQSMKMGFLKPLVSASVPRMGPRIAVTTVTMELA